MLQMVECVLPKFGTFCCSCSLKHSILKRFGDIIGGIDKIPRNVLQNGLSIRAIVRFGLQYVKGIPLEIELLRPERLECWLFWKMMVDLHPSRALMCPVLLHPLKNAFPHLLACLRLRSFQNETERREAVSIPCDFCPGAWRSLKMMERRMFKKVVARRGWVG